MNVSTVFEKPAGAVTLDRTGKWWITRETLGIDPIVGTVRVQIGDGDHVVQIEATPEQLARLSQAIVAQVEAAIVNTGA